MKTVGVRALKQNASAVVAEAANGEVITITDRGRPVAQLVPLHADRLATLVISGRARPALRSLADLASPAVGAGPALSVVLEEMRRGERY